MTDEVALELVRMFSVIVIFGGCLALVGIFWSMIGEALETRRIRKIMEKK